MLNTSGSYLYVPDSLLSFDDDLDEFHDEVRISGCQTHSDPLDFIWFKTEPRRLYCELSVFLLVEF